MSTLRKCGLWISGSLLLALAATPTGAVVCANGVYRAGCVGPNGAVGVRKRYAPPPAAVVVPGRAVVVAPAPRAVIVRPPVRCAWVNGARVCR